jgi:hypothetical protein
MKEFDTTNKYGYRFVLLLIFVISFFAVRIPLLHEDLGSEEGIFAELLVNRPCGPYYNLFGRINGQKQYGYISHPAVPYELLRLGGYLSQRFLTYDVYLDDARITPRVRAIISLYQFAFWVLLLVFITRFPQRKWLFLIVFMAMLSPLAVETSTFLQIDNSSGLLLCGTAALLFSLPDTLAPGAMSILFVFCGGFLAGLGKQEWSLPLLAALAGTLGLHFFRPFQNSNLKPLNIISYIAAGLLAGNLASCLYDPANYTRGFHYILSFSKLSDISPEKWSFSHWLGLTCLRLPFVSICLILALIIIWSVVSSKRKTVLSCIIILYGFFLLTGYVLSDWRSDPRYFAPSLAVLVIAAITTLPNPPSLWNRRIIIVGLFSVLLTTIVFLIWRKPNRSFTLEQINAGRLKSSENTMLFIGSGAGWNKPHIDYQNNNIPYENAKQKYFRKFNKELVKPENVKKNGQ